MTTATWTNVQKRIKTNQIPPVYGILVVVFILAIIVDAIWGRGQMLDQEILTNMLVRSVALGIVAVGQTFVMIGASIDLSVAFMVSVTAVMASFLMQGDPSRVPMAIAVVVGIGIFVGLLNGVIITKLKVNPFIATLGVGLLLKGVLNASFENFVGSVPKSFQTSGLWRHRAAANLGPGFVDCGSDRGLYPGLVKIWCSPLWGGWQRGGGQAFRFTYRPGDYHGPYHLRADGRV